MSNQNNTTIQSNKCPADVSATDDYRGLDDCKNLDKNVGQGTSVAGDPVVNGKMRAVNGDSNGITEFKKEPGEKGKEEEEEKLMAVEKGSDNGNMIDESHVGLDGGYGWFIVLGAFMSWSLCAGLMKGAGIIVLIFQEKYDAGALQAAWPCSILSWLQSLSGPVVAAVCNRFSVRTSLMIGTALTVTGLVLTALVANFYFLFFSFSLLQGVGMGFMLTPGLFIVSSYFEQHRGFAVSLASAGGGVGPFLIVPLVDLLSDVYGYQGCFLVMAGILANGFVVALLYRPFRAHQKYILTVKKSCKESVCLDEDVEGNGDGSHIPLKDTANVVHKPEIRKRQILKASCCLELKSCAKICFPSDHKKSENKKIFHFELLKNPFFCWFLLSSFLFTVALKGTYTFIPAMAIDNGITKGDAALILSVMGGVDTFGRIGCGLLFDLALLKPYRPLFFTGSLFASALTSFFIPFFNGYAVLMFVCCLMGTFFGLHISQRAVVIVDLMGKSMLSSCIGFAKLVQAFGLLSGPLIFGAIRDKTGSYNIAFSTASGLMLASGVFMTISIAIFRIQTRKKKEKEEDEQRHKEEEEGLSNNE